MLTIPLENPATRAMERGATPHRRRPSGWRALLGLIGMLVGCSAASAQETRPAAQDVAGEVRPFPKPNAVFEYNRGVVRRHPDATP